MYEYKMLSPMEDVSASLDYLSEQFAGIYTESWYQDKASHHPGKEYQMNVGVFADMWMRRALRIFMAYENGKPCGYLIGMLFRPLTHQASVFQVEDWYAQNKNAEVVEGLFKYMLQGLEFIGVDEIWVAHGEDETYPALPATHWRDRSGTIIDRHVKV